MNVLETASVLIVQVNLNMLKKTGVLLYCLLGDLLKEYVQKNDEYCYEVLQINTQSDSEKSFRRCTF